MTHRVSLTAAPLASVVLLLALVAPPVAGLEWQSNASLQGFRASPPRPVSAFPSFRFVLPIPEFADLSRLEEIVVNCNVLVEKNEKPVRKAKGSWEAAVFSLDETGLGEFLQVDRGRFRTAESGEKLFTFSVPKAAFAAGFEAEDVTVWVFVEGRFTNTRKATYSLASCGLGVRQD